MTVINAAFGHNEGMVNDKVPTDTYYLYPDGLNHEVIREGWSKHPIAATESLKEYSISEEFLDELYHSIDLKGYQLSREFRENPTLEALLESLASEDVAEGNTAAKDLVVVFYQIVKRLGKEKYFGHDILFNRGKQLLLNAMVLCKDHLQRKEPKRRLHTVSRFEAMLMQEASLRILNSDSLGAIINERKTAKGIEVPKRKTSSKVDVSPSELMKRREHYTCMMVYHSVKVLALSEEVKQAWSLFANEIASSSSRVLNRRLLDLINKLDGMGILAEWMNDHFILFYKRAEGSVPLLDALIAEMDSTQELQEEYPLSEFNRDLRQWENNLKDFEEPTKFAETWEQFEQKVVKPLLLLSEGISTEVPRFLTGNSCPIQSSMLRHSV
ncbi:MAG: hypothetical protein K940chlam7_00505 [Chlamydiae bacterium]|nr:hypothetical protein [Chlamydiota bacterium]